MNQPWRAIVTCNTRLPTPRTRHSLLRLHSLSSTTSRALHTTLKEPRIEFGTLTSSQTQHHFKMLGSSKKSKAVVRPAPLDISVRSGEPSASPTSASSQEGAFDYFRRPTFPGHSRQGSESSSKGYTPTKSASFPSPSIKSPKSNVYTTCGRHSNEWLFSGWFGKKA